MKRAALALVTALVVALPVFAAQPASAGGGGGITAFSVTSMTLTAGGNIKLAGTVTCTPGFRTRGQIIVGKPAVQPITNQATGHFDPLNCTGGSQVWHATAMRTLGALSLGAAQYSITMRTNSIICCAPSVNLFFAGSTIT